MKKISLKNVKETLSRKEMRTIAGGYGSGCPTGEYLCLCSNGRMGCDTISSCMTRCGL